MSAMSRVLRALLLACAAVVLTAGPAAADAAGPTDFRSEVTGLVPESDVVQAEIRGGDSFLELRVDEGHTVIVYGYTDGADGDGLGNDPYLRFNPDGTVERNRMSTATYLNEDRQGDVEVPPETNDPTLEPEWEQVADGGVYAWHDHRVHWMLDDPPQDTDRGEAVGGEFDPWRVPISIDGEAVEIQGTLTYEEPVSLLPLIAVGLLVAAGLAWFGRTHPVLVATSALTLASALAVVVGRAELDASPAGQSASPLLWVLPAIALATAVAGLFLYRRPAGVLLALVSVATLVGWALLRLGVLLKPVLPTELPAGLDRLSVVLALAVGAAAAYLTVTSGSLRLPSLDDDDPDEHAGVTA